MPGKMTNSILRPPFRPPQVPAAVRSSRLSCGKVGKAQIFTSARESSGESRLSFAQAFLNIRRRVLRLVLETSSRHEALFLALTRLPQFCLRKLFSQQIGSLANPANIG
jgi:hypothetical protein